MFVDFDKEDITTKAADAGPPGLLVTYGGEEGGTVFLAGVTGLAARDLAFA